MIHSPSKDQCFYLKKPMKTRVSMPKDHIRQTMNDQRESINVIRYAAYTNEKQQMMMRIQCLGGDV